MKSSRPVGKGSSYGPTTLSGALPSATRSMFSKAKRTRGSPLDSVRSSVAPAAMVTGETRVTGSAFTQVMLATSAPAPSGGGGVCPVAGAVSFTDSWGAPRSGGRSHKGVDMIAARGVPIVAIFSGRVQRTSNSSLGGKSVYFVSDAGDMYYYAHLDDFGDISSGQSVPAGYVLGYNGSSGNAPSYLPHLHFEYHPDGGDPVNPFVLLDALC